MRGLWLPMKALGAVRGLLPGTLWIYTGCSAGPLRVLVEVFFWGLAFIQGVLLLDTHFFFGCPVGVGLAFICFQINENFYIFFLFFCRFFVVFLFWGP